jgi:hypothetical protein
MEDVFSVYERPYDPLLPVVCIDESSRQLIGHTKVPIPASPGHTEIWDYEYKRNGVADVFMIFEPLGSRHHVQVTKTRTRKDFAECLRHTSEEMYPHAERIVLVCDNLNTHSLGSLYEAFPPEDARRIASRFEVHYTPKHGSWLDMAEIELGVLKRQCLSERIATIEDMEREIRAWELERSSKCLAVNWQFTTEDARIKLQRLYPQFSN